MKDLRNLVHSAHHLIVFEAAARHQSFTGAARELNVSQPAVSLSMRQLESALRVQLFTRQHRSVALTQAGETLFQEVSEGFSRILDTARLLRRRARKAHVTLSTSTAFANYWMVPRLAEFNHKHPGIDLRLQTADKDLDLADEGISLGIRRGKGLWRGYSAELIAQEILYPVAGGRVAEKFNAGARLKKLAATRLIYLEEPYRPRPTWHDWFGALNTPFKDDGAGLRLNDYSLVLQAAMAGEGIAMGWDHIVGPLLRSKLLVRIGDWSWRTDNGFYLIWSDKTELSEQASIVRSWIIETAKADRNSELMNSA